MANHHQQQQHRKPIVSHELALASDLFDKFCGATTLKTILSHYRSLCEILNMKPNNFPHFYPKLKSKLCSWRAQALWNKFDKRANHKCYNRGKACANTRVFIIGAGPCGLRAAIEAQLLGAKVVVIEKRDRISRNNVLHLWPFVIHDLRSLGAKKFFGKFCAGSIDHISIRQLQCILLKVALLLGVEIHEGVSFESLLPPSSHIEERTGWRAKISPEDHPVSQYEFDVLIGADGKRNTLEGFKRKEFRGKLAIAITANFINHRTEAEARVEEISGVAYIFNQKFFKDLRSATGIDLENIVYYKDDTHYFVMTAKKPSLLDKGVILKDYADTARLLAIDNINKDALMEYAKEAANFSTNYKLPELQFAVNHYGQPDVAMFDFTSMYAAENASRVIQEKGYKLLMCLVGDSLLEPFWPTGSGCARGFLSSMDACWAVRSWGSSSCTNPLEVMAERESIYRLLNQTTPENLSRDHANYMLDPHTRYANLNLRAVLPVQVKSLYSSDDPASIELYLKSPSSVIGDHSKKRRRRDTQIHHDVLLSWLKRQVALCDDIRIENTNSSFKNGLALCAIIYRYRPDLIDFHSLDPSNVAENNQLAFNVLEKEYGILPVMTGIEMEACETPDNLTMLSYLTQVYDVFRGEIPYSHQKRTDDDSFVNASIAAAGTKTTPYKNAWNKMNQTQKLSMMGRLASSIPRKRYRESRSPTVTCKSYDAQTPRKPKKRKSASTAGCSVEQRKNHLLERLKKELMRKEDDKFTQKDEGKRIDGARKDWLENFRKPVVRKHHERNERYGSKTVLAARAHILEMARRARLDDRVTLRDHQEKLIATGIMEKVRMLQENQNQEPDSIPFEDISMFLYREVAPEFKERVKDWEKKLTHSDRDVKELQELKKLPMEVNFSGRIKDIETKLKEGNQLQKKPKDLMRAIGKIEKTDWNINALEKKIEENKFGRGMTSAEVAKVPKWNRQQFDDKFTAVKKKLIDKDTSPSRQPSAKYTDVDSTLKVLERKLRNGTVLEQGQRGANKVSAMAAQLATMNQQPEERCILKSASKLIIPNQGGSETCHFCNKRVYLMERLNAEGRFFHRGCFRCEYCGTALRLGNYNFDRDGKFGSRFYCAQHFGYPGVHRKKNRNYDYKSEAANEDTKGELDVLAKTPTSTMDLNFSTESTDTPERVGFENLDVDKEDARNASFSEMDEDEWTDHNFGTSANELASSDDVSNISESEEEDRGEFAQASDIPGPHDNKSLEFAQPRFAPDSLPSVTVESSSRRNSFCSARDVDENAALDSKDSDSSLSDDGSSPHITYHEFDSEESTTTAERDRVHLKVPKRSPCAYSSATSESDTEMGSDAYSTSSNNDSDEDIDAYYDDHEYDEDDDDDDDDEDEDEEEEEDDDDSATEISTDSEFERNNSTIIKSEMPDIIISGRLPTRKTRLEEVKSVQILDRSALICNKNVDKVEKDTEPEEAREDEVKLGKLPYANLPRKNYLINRTQSTEGVASKISLELKKKYLLGGDRANSPVKKSESTSVLDMKFKSLVDQISEHQKLLNPSTDPSQTSPQTFTETSAKLSPSIINASAAANSLNSRKSKELSGLEDFPHVCDLATNNFDRPIRKIQFGIENASQLEINAVATDKLTNESTLNSTPLESTVTEKVTGPVIEQDTSERRKSLESRITLDKTQIPNDFPKSESLPTNVQKAEAKCGFFVAPEQTSKTSSVEIDKDDREASLNKIMAMPLMDNSKDRDAQILRLVATPAELFVSKDSNSEPKGGLNSDKSSPSTPSSSQGDENTLAVFTETELSDWARDEDDAVSENLEDLILDPPTPNITYRRHQRPKKRAAANKPITLAKDKDDVKNDYVHVCGRTERPRPTSLALASLDDMDIDFMDTVVDDVYGHNMETINSALVKNRGYIEYVTNQEEIKTPLAETINVNDSSFTDRNIPTSRDNIVPEDHSCSSNNSIIDNSEEKIGQDSGVISKFEANVNDVKEDDKNNKVLSDDYDKFVHRLQERITPFNNVKDSIDIRKSRRSGKSNSPSPLTSPAVEEPCTIEPQPQVLQGSLQKLEKLEQERSKQKSIIHDMVMSKLQAQGKSIRDRKMKRNARNSLSPFGSSSQNSLLSRTSDEMKKDEIRFTVDAEDDKENTRRGPAAEKNYDHTVDWPAAAAAPPSHTIKDMYSESFSLPDLRKALNEAGDEPLSNVLPLPSPAKLQVLECTESIRQQARTRARLMSDSELGLSPEDKLRLLKQKIAARKAVQSAYMDYPKTNNSADAKVSYSNKVLDALDDVIRRDGENHKDHSGESAQTSRLKITRDKDRRKSIIRAVSDFFKKSPVKVAQSIDASVSGGSISPKFKLISSSFMGKEKSKSADNVLAHFTTQNNINNAMSSEKDLQHSNLTRKSELERPKQDNTVPLSRLNYTSNSDENLLSTTSSTGNCDRNSTSLQSNNLRSSHRKAKQENQKRLRMAQEIQRQLEEIEVKQRELEIKGVNVEKALRNNQNSDCEFELMRELLDMIRERNELRKYEQKLLLKAKAIEADDPNLR